MEHFIIYVCVCDGSGGCSCGGGGVEQGKMGEPVTNEEVEEELGLEGNVEVKGDESGPADKSIEEERGQRDEEW